MIDEPNRWNDGEENPLFSGDDEAIETSMMATPVDDPHDMCECCLRLVLKTQEYGYRDPQQKCHLVCEPCADTCEDQQRPLPGMPPVLSPQPLIIRLAAFVRVVSKGKPDPVEIADRAKRVLIPVSELPRAVTDRRKDAGEFVTVKTLCEEWIPAVSGGSLIYESFELYRLELISECAQALSRSLGEAIAIYAELDHVNGDERQHEAAEAIREAKAVAYGKADSSCPPSRAPWPTGKGARTRKARRQEREETEMGRHRRTILRAIMGEGGYGMIWYRGNNR